MSQERLFSNVPLLTYSQSSISPAIYIFLLSPLARISEIKFTISSICSTSSRCVSSNKFSKTALSEGKKDGTCYSLPLYSHAQVMWYRKDLLQKAGLSVPKTWDEFAEAAKTLTRMNIS